MSLRHPELFDILFYKGSIATIPVELVQSTVLGLVPTSVHEMKHPAIPFVLWLRQTEGIERSWLFVIRQVRRHGVPQQQIEVTIAIRIKKHRRETSVLADNPRLLGDISEKDRPISGIVSEKSAVPEAHPNKEILIAIVVDIREYRARWQAVFCGVGADGIERGQRDLFKY